MDDKRYQEIMSGLPYPESRSVLQALKQVANEVAQNKEAEHRQEIDWLSKGLTNIANNTDLAPNDMHAEAERLLSGIRKGWKS